MDASIYLNRSAIATGSLGWAKIHPALGQSRTALYASYLASRTSPCT